MTNSDLVSIITPFKNSSKFLEECLISIINQSYKTWELIMIDDYSNDNSFDIANKIAENDKRIKLYKNKGNKGIIHSLRLGLKKCSGNYITRMDSDDIMHEDKIKELLNSLKKKGKGYVSTSKVKYFSKKGVGLGYKKYENWLNKMMEYNDNYDHIYKECVIPSPNWMIHIDDLLNCSAFDSEIYPEDYDLVFRFYKNNIKIIPSQKTLHKWRDYPVRTSRTDSNYADNSFLDLKLKYFIELNYDTNKMLVIWGAGRRGKFLAKKLSALEIDFVWVCNNPNKIDQVIYNKQLKNVEHLNKLKNFQTIITVANDKSQLLINNFFKSKGLIKMKDYYFFC